MLAGACALLAAVAVGCGGDDRQDANEPEGDFEVEVLDASFPERQRLAETATLAITVRNESDETLPDVAVTLRGLTERSEAEGLSDPNRPVFVINGRPAEIGGYQEVKLDAPDGGPTALVDTWTLGELEPGEKTTFRWRVTPVRPGPFEVTYAVAGGLDGKARAVTVGGEVPQGAFRGTVTARPPQSRVADDGRTVVAPAP
ncbi:MAG: hypothetical protein GXY03_14050 [Solirubrobacterales bacterium]|nr:hypothetical protein [Solirubrobacterales bacterium]